MVYDLPPHLAVNMSTGRYESITKKQPQYKILSGLAILLVVCAALTILPYSAASKANLLGYKSLCAFVPLSTLILLGAAGFVRIIRDVHSR